MNRIVKTSSLSTAVITAILPLACCWGPTLLAGVAILGGVATNLSWLHPYEPWLYVISFSTLGYSHYQAYKKSKADDMNCQHCATNENTQLTPSRYSNRVLWIVTALVLLLFFINQFPELLD